MLLAKAPIDLGIHQGSPTSAPPSLRSVKTPLSFSTRAVASWVVVTQTRPTIGNRVNTTGPEARNIATPAPGSRRKASLAKSTRSAINRSATPFRTSHQDGAERPDGKISGEPGQAAMRRDPEKAPST